MTYALPREHEYLIMEELSICVPAGNAAHFARREIRNETTTSTLCPDRAYRISGRSAYRLINKLAVGKVPLF